MSSADLNRNSSSRETVINYKLAKYRLPTKKGILFYGPPGTGKTHTIHYLAKALEGHTTLVITAEQVGLLSEYMTLARLLQPSLVIMEDVDLIAKDRAQMGVCEEVFLNKLLNEMDGLNQEADILFILTTNRPEALERALASRPGRVDQAIEFPMPDEVGRAKLIRLVFARDAINRRIDCISRSSNRKGECRLHQRIDATNRAIPFGKKRHRDKLNFKTLIMPSMKCSSAADRLI